MGRTVFSLIMTIGLSALLATVGSDTTESIDRAEEGSWTHKCVCVAHGSTDDPGKAKKAKPEKPGNGKGGGGKKTKECYKTFGEWGSSSLTVWVDDSGAPTGFSGLLADYVDDAMEEWACYSGVTVSDAPNADAADITVEWGDEGGTGTLGVTYISGFGSTITSARVVMNSNQQGFDWTQGPALQESADGCNTEVADGSSSDYDLRSVTIHEIGHAWGIDHPTRRCRSNDACYGETMFPCTGPGEWSRRALNAGDKLAISSLYGE